MLRFTMDQKRDLSNRTDFTYDLMQSIAKIARSSVESSQAIDKLKDRADVDVRVTNSLGAVDVRVDVKPHEGVALSEGEVAEARAQVMEGVNTAVKAGMSEALQASMKNARTRM